MLVPVAMFLRQIRRVRNGVQGKVKAAVWFFCLSLIPVIAYALVSFGLIALEEVTKYAVVSEGFARTFLLIVAMGLSEVVLLTVGFVLTVAFFIPTTPTKNTA